MTRPTAALVTVVTTATLHAQQLGWQATPLVIEGTIVAIAPDSGEGDYVVACRLRR